MMKTVVYDGENNVVGEVEVYVDDMIKKSNNNYSNSDYSVLELMKKGLKIRGLSKGGERCNPLAVLYTISSLQSSSSNGVRFKLIEFKSYFHQQHQQETPLFGLHSICLRDNKTIVVPFGDEEIHLVAMRSKRINGGTACFWGFNVAPGLYEACLGMLNPRCLGIVFDLDETLIVANTLRSFEDRIEALQRRLGVETDSQRIAGMMGEIKRYQDDKSILKQYAETDQVVDNGKVHKIQAEVVPALTDNHQTVVRPLIRLPDKNIVLTRINPQIRDTSVLVRLRPAWEDLRSYLTAKGRKRFEVYVCTMAERDYALEMWRLLDPDSNLINPAEVLERIVCVKSGSKKSLFNVFHNGICHPKMALVIDDRLKVWDEEDQPRVHVVPAFAPYYAPQAEANNAIPVLCVARNVACNVRGGFFKEFDDVLLQRCNEISFEDDLKDIPSPPDVSNYLVSEDNDSGSNGNKEPARFDGMADTEVERRLKEATLGLTPAPSLSSLTNVNHGPGLASSLSFTMAAAPAAIPQVNPQTSVTPFHTNVFPQVGSPAKPLGSIGPPAVGLSLHNSTAPEEGEVPESELDPDTRRRLLILQHGHDAREKLLNEASFPVRPPPQALPVGPIPGPQPIAGPGPGIGPGPGPGPGPVRAPGPDLRMQSRGNWFPEEHMYPGPLSRPFPNEYPIGPDCEQFERQRPPPFHRRMDSSIRSDRFFPENQRPPREAPRRDDRLRLNRSLPGHQSFKGNDSPPSRSSSKKDSEVVSERSNSFPETPSGALHDIATRVGAKVEFRAGLVPSMELRFFMEAYFAGERIGEGTGVKRKEAQHRAAEAALMNLADRYLSHVKSDSPQSDITKGQSPTDIGHPRDSHSSGDSALAKEETVPSIQLTKPDSSVDDSSTSPVSALQELCTREGLGVEFRAPSPSTSAIQGVEICAEAAEKALSSLKTMHKRPGSPRSLEGITSKRLRPDYTEVL